MNLKRVIESILFVSGKPVSLSELVKITNKPPEDVKTALDELKNNYRTSGIIITETNDSFQMATNPECSPQVKKFLQAQLNERLTDAALETLSIVCYKQPVSRAEIESIRGVNSQYILWLLLQRGLIEKISHPNDARVLLYRATHELLNHLGISEIAELPEFEKLTEHLKNPDGNIKVN